MTHPDLVAVLNTILPMAKALLQEDGGFYPFGASMNRDGKVSPIAATSGGADATTEQVAGALAEAFRNMAKDGTLRAAGLCSDVRVTREGATEPTDAIHVRLSHESGETLDVFVPYRHAPPADPAYGDMFGAVGTLDAFHDPGTMDS